MASNQQLKTKKHRESIDLDMPQDKTTEKSKDEKIFESEIVMLEANFSVMDRDCGLVSSTHGLGVISWDNSLVVESIIKGGHAGHQDLYPAMTKTDSKSHWR